MEHVAARAQQAADKEGRPYGIFFDSDGETTYYEKPLDQIEHGEPGLAIRVVMPTKDEGTRS